jgi:hypothetical protein
MRASVAGDFAAQTNMPEAVFQRALDGVGEFTDGILRRVA